MKRQKKKRETDENKKGKFRTAISFCTWFCFYGIEANCTNVHCTMCMHSLDDGNASELLISFHSHSFSFVSRIFFLLCEQKKLVLLTANHIFLCAPRSQENGTHKLYHSNMTQILILSIYAWRAHNSAYYKRCNDWIFISKCTALEETRRFLMTHLQNHSLWFTNYFEISTFNHFQSICNAKHVVT